jgi:hypothetical protein
MWITLNGEARAQSKACRELRGAQNQPESPGLFLEVYKYKQEGVPKHRNITVTEQAVKYLCIEKDSNLLPQRAPIR